MNLRWLDRLIVAVSAGLVLCLLVALVACNPGDDPGQQRRDNGEYYRSCDDVPGPLRAGDRGYRSGLDQDGNGVACDE